MAETNSNPPAEPQEVNGTIRNKPQPLSHYRGCVVVAANIFPTDPEKIERDLGELGDYGNLLMQLRDCKVNKESLKGEERESVVRMEEDALKEIKKLEKKSDVVTLYDIFSRFSEAEGVPIVSGLVGRLFDEGQSQAYANAKNVMESQTDYIKTLLGMRPKKKLRIDTDVALQIIKQAKDAKVDEAIDATLVDAAQIYFDLSTEKTGTANNIWESLKPFLSKPKVTFVRGKNDRSHRVWGAAEGAADLEFKLEDGTGFKVAFFGGHNYGTRTQTGPDELIKPGPSIDQLCKFLEKAEFDMLVFSGSYNIINHAINMANAATTKRTWKSLKRFGRKTSNIEGKIIMVTDPDEPEVIVGYDSKGQNLVVRGVNYSDGRMLLIDPRRKGLNLLVMTPPKYEPLGEDKLASECEILEAHSYANGEFRENIKLPDKPFAGDSTSIIDSNIVRYPLPETTEPEVEVDVYEAHRVGDSTEIRIPVKSAEDASEGGLFSRLWPWVAAIGVGAAGGYAAGSHVGAKNTQERMGVLLDEQSDTIDNQMELLKQYEK